MIDRKKIFADTWNSCSSIDDAITYINKLPLTDKQFKELEKLFEDIIDDYCCLKEEAAGQGA